MHQESEVRIHWDHATGVATVHYHGEYYILGIYRNQSSARIAGEDFCRTLGWTG